MKITIKGSPEDISALFTGCDDETFETETDMNIREALDDIRETEYFAESRKELLPVNEMNRYHMVDALREFLKETDTQTIFDETLFLALILNLSDEIIAYIKEEYGEDCGVGNCYANSFKSPS